MNFTSDRIDERNKSFLRSLDADEVKKRRDDNIVELRKKKRMDNLVKRSRNTQSLSSSQISFDPSQVESILSAACPQLIDASISNGERILLLTSLISTLCQGPPQPSSPVLPAAIELLCKLASSENTQALQVIWESGVSLRLIELLGHSSDKIKFHCAWILTNLSSQTTEVCNRLAEQGAVEALSRIAASDVISEHTHQALWALSNFAGDNPALRNRVFATGISANIIRIFNTSQSIDLSNLGIMVWLLSNLFKFRPLPSNYLMKEFIQLLPKLLPMSHEGILMDTLRTLSYITVSPEHIQAVLNTGFVGRIITLLAHESHKVKQCALNLVSNLSGGDQVQTQSLLENNLVPFLYSALAVNKTNVKRDVLFVMSNIVMGPWEHKLMILSHKEFKEVVGCVEHMDREVRIEALYVLKCSCSDPKFLLPFVEAGAMERLLNALEYGDSDIILMALDVIEKMLGSEQRMEYPNVIVKFNELAGFDRLARLQSHPNSLVYDRCSKVISACVDGDISQNYMVSDTFSVHN